MSGLEKSAHRRGIKGRGHKRKKTRKLRLTCLQSKDKSSLRKGFKIVSRARDNARLEVKNMQQKGAMKII